MERTAPSTQRPEQIEAIAKAMYDDRNGRINAPSWSRCSARFPQIAHRYRVLARDLAGDKR